MCWRITAESSKDMEGNLQLKKKKNRDFPAGAVVKNPPANAGDTGRSLVRKDPTCHGATKPVRHNYWACVLEPASHNCWALVPQLLKPVHLEPVLRSKRSHRNEKPAHRNEEQPRSPQLERARTQQPTQPKINKINKFI